VHRRGCEVGGRWYVFRRNDLALKCKHLMAQVEELEAGSASRMWCSLSAVTSCLVLIALLHALVCCVQFERFKCTNNYTRDRTIICSSGHL
jgi:hypothetical protein